MTSIELSIHVMKQLWDEIKTRFLISKYYLNNKKAQVHFQIIHGLKAFRLWNAKLIKLRLQLELTFSLLRIQYKLSDRFWILIGFWVWKSKISRTFESVSLRNLIWRLEVFVTSHRVCNQRTILQAHAKKGFESDIIYQTSPPAMLMVVPSLWYLMLVDCIKTFFSTREKKWKLVPFRQMWQQDVFLSLFCIKWNSHWKIK